jgi:excisionase family DNA binding protein
MNRRASLASEKPVPDREPFPPTDGHLLMTVEETATAMQIGRNTVYGLIQRGELPVVPFGRTIRVSRAALERWIEQRSTPLGVR